MAANAHPGIADRQPRQPGERRAADLFLRGCFSAGSDPAAGGRVEIEVEPRPLHRHVQRIEKGFLAAQQRREIVAGADARGLERGEGPGARLPARAHSPEFEAGEHAAADLRDRRVEAERLAQGQNDERPSRGPRKTAARSSTRNTPQKTRIRRTTGR